MLKESEYKLKSLEIDLNGCPIRSVSLSSKRVGLLYRPSPLDLGSVSSSLYSSSHSSSSELSLSESSSSTSFTFCLAWSVAPIRQYLSTIERRAIIFIFYSIFRRVSSPSGFGASEKASFWVIDTKRWISRCMRMLAVRFSPILFWSEAMNATKACFCLN